MANLEHYHPRDPNNFIEPSKKDYVQFAKLQSESYSHKSLGSFNMMAAWVRGSQCVFGCNKLKRSAAHENKSFPLIAGFHAELSLFYKSDFSGGTVYIAGNHNKSGTPLNNTGPCSACKALLIAAKVRYVVFSYHGKVVKAKPIHC